MRYVILMFVLLGCAAPVGAPCDVQSMPEPGQSEIVTYAAPYAAVLDEPEPEPEVTATPEVVPFEFWGKTGGPVMDPMDPSLVAQAVELTNAQLTDMGLEDRAEPVPVFQGSMADMQWYRGKRVFGTARDGQIMVGEGDLCDSPDGYGTRLVGWVLSHELLHTIGYEHGEEMTAVTDPLGARWRELCGLPPAY